MGSCTAILVPTAPEMANDPRYASVRDRIIPSDRREDRCADGREIAVRAMLRDQLSTDDDEIAEEAIVVGIGGTSADMLGIGLSYDQPMGTIYRTARVTEKGVFDAVGETGWWTVRDALAPAHVLQQRMGHERVAMTMADVGIWRRRMGKLVKREGF